MSERGRHGHQAVGRSAPRPAQGRQRRWTPGSMPFSVTVRNSGIEIGAASTGERVAYSLLVPTGSTRVGVAGDPRFARLLTVRLLAASCDVLVVTQDPDPWQRLAAGLPGTPLSVARQITRWPAESSSPPWALIADAAEPPPPNFARAGWSTVVHTAPNVLVGNAWWQSAHLVVAGRAQARELTALRPRMDRSVLDRLGDDDLVAVEPGGATVFRVVVRDDERRALSE